MEQHAESFGQRVDLCVRLQEILRNYPEGTSVLRELIQNADDAGARCVKLCLDTRTHPRSSLAFAEAAAFQGTSLLAFNDATFTEADFTSISRIGDSVKREQVGKTGRFGIGFNSVYHLTDLPSFVSGSKVTLFDPHCAYLPGITAASPGLRLDFVAHAVAAGHPDQYAPYAAFGCDVASRAAFGGTLFRFPLRTEAQAATSRLSSQPHSAASMRALLHAFAGEAVECLLFLKSVERVEVLEWPAGAPEPQLLFCATVQAQRSERAAFSRLAAAAASGGAREGRSCYSAMLSLASSLPNLPSTTSTYLFSQALGGGRSWAVAEAGRKLGVRLVPWASVAARVGGPPLPHSAGRAFCFLPLPVHTGLPVHVNAYFELSSNRRDIWHGEDMAGGGALRSEWNACLLTDVVAPAYARLLAEAASLVGPRSSPEDVYALFPAALPREPWGACVRSLFAAMQGLRVLHTTRGGGEWIAPGEALLPDAVVQESAELTEVHIIEGMPLVTLLPEDVRALMAAHAPRVTSPGGLRSALRRAGARPVTVQRRLALAALAYCLSDVRPDETAVEAMAGVPLLPLADGRLVTFAPRGAAGSHRAFCASPLEHALLARAPQLCVDRGVGDSVLSRLTALAEAGGLNLELVCAESLARELMPHILPPDWRGQRQTPWSPGEQGQPSEETLRLLWTRLADCEDLDLFAAWPLLPTADGALLASARVAPLVACGLDADVAAALLRAGVRSLRPGIAQHATLPRFVRDATVGGVLDALGAVDGGAAAGLLQQHATAEERTALATFLLQPAWWSSREAQEARLALLRSLPIFETFPDPAASPSPSPPRSFVTLTKVAGLTRFLPPPGVDEALLSSLYLRAHGAPAATVLSRALGVQPRGRAAFFREDLLTAARWAALPPELRQSAALALLRDLAALCAEDRDLAAALAHVPFLPTPSGQARAPSALYDPRVPEFAALLDAGTCFPAPPFDAPELAGPLAALGVQRGVTRQVVLQAAHGVEALAARGQAGAAQSRGAALLRILDLEVARLLDPDFGKPLAGVLKSLGGLVSADARAARAESGSQRDAFLAELRAIAWCPVLSSPPEAGMPWPAERARTAVAPPQAVRPRGDGWLVSAAAPLLAADCSSGALDELLGWSAPPSAAVLGTQLRALGALHGEVGDTALGQALSAALPRLYTLLGAALSTPGFGEVASTLRACASVWTGAGFAPPCDVAFSGPLNLGPYLHVLPADLACFRALLATLGVRAAFGPADFRSVLTRLAAHAGHAPVNQDQLSLAVWLLQQLAEARGAGADGEQPLFAPDAGGVLRPASSLVFNDAPWLDAPAATDVTLAHPLLSHAVAEAAGVRSMRRLLLAESACQAMELGLAGASEAFGQHEALTTRLRHIIDAYADGPGILSELVQNADDAGASHVAFLLDEGSYGTNSILGGRMADWQGPALLCYNDKLFQPSDFAAISRIGQDSKVDKPAAAGRFGLGFNAVYHFTDIPSFVSGEYLVYFDPHAANLPGTSAAHPGLRINFSRGRLLQQFPDQLAPLLQFGNTCAAPFPGTLFRFPLRTAACAQRSEIKAEAYSPAAVRELLQSFREGATRTLLFLKNVRRISVMARAEGDAQPRILYEVTLDTPQGDPRAPAVDFVASCSARKQFHAMLARVPEAQLPIASGLVEVRMREDDHEEPPERWLLCSAIGGGKARDMAVCDVSGRGLVPWASVAARLPDESSANAAPLRGRAFCFLPLPVHTGLPVHVNAYFELSSNRRDIWHGDDMAGGGAQRSEWNACLLTDVVAPAYAWLLVEAAKALGACDAFFSLFPPADGLSEPWHTALVRRLYASCLLTLPVLPSAASPGAWLTPRASVFPDHTPAGRAPELQAALLAEGLPLTAPVPARICDAFAAAAAPGLRFLTPALVRELLRGAAPHASLQQRSSALALLHYSLSDVVDDDAGSASALAGVPLLPLANGGWAAFAVRGPQAEAPCFLVTTELEATLLVPCAPELLVERRVPHALQERLCALAEAGSLNLGRLGDAALAALLPRLLPAAWRGRAEAAWSPGERGHPSEQTLRLLWTRLADCASLDAFAPWPLLPTLAPVGPLLLLPPRPGCGVLSHASGAWSENLAAALHAAGCRLQSPHFPEVTHPQLRACVHDASAPGVLDAIAAALGPALPANLPEALHSRLAGASDAERTELRAFLLQSKWHAAGAGALSDAQLAVLRALPIFETFSSEPRTRFVALSDGIARALPPLGPEVDACLLDGAVVRPGGAREAAVLCSLGIAPAPRAAFFRAQALTRVRELPASTRDATFAELLRDQGALAAEDAGFLEALARTPFVPVAGAGAAELRCPDALYDPRVSTLAVLLAGAPVFPAPPFHATPALDALVRLGMRRSLGAQGMLHAAGCVEAVSRAEGEEAGAARGAALLRHLDGLADPDEAAAGAPDVPAFWSSLAALAWCPAQTQPPMDCPGLPWPTSGAPLPRMAPPRACRPAADAWLASACCRLLDAGLAVKAPLAARLGWAAPPAAAALAAQLLELSKRHAAMQADARAEALAAPGTAPEGDEPPFAPAVPGAAALAALQATLDAAAPRLYAAMAAQAQEGDKLEVMRAVLDGAPCIWVSEGFVPASIVAFDASPAYAPYLYAAPVCCCEHRALLLALGARETLDADDFCAALRRVAAEQGGQPLPADLLPLAVELAERAADFLAPQQRPPVAVYLPDAQGVMVPATDLLFNDAAWLADDGDQQASTLQLAHPSLPATAAERLGCRSLRQLFLVDQKMTDRLSCPPAATLAALLAGHADADMMLLDILEVADAAGASGCEVILDERSHKRQSLLSPLLGAYQGPALLIRLEGVVLSDSELCSLLASPSPVKLRGRACRFGNGLLGMFHITDLPCVLAGDKLYMFDPTGLVLGREGAPPPAQGKVAQPLGKAFTFVGTDLPRRFADQFAPFSGCGDFSAPCNATLLRLPLRHAAASPLGRPVYNAADAQRLLGALLPRGETALLFTASLRRLRVSCWDADADNPAGEPLLDASITQCDAEARALVDDKEWRRTSLFTLLAGANATRRAGTLTLAHRRCGGAVVQDQFVIAGVVGGAGRAREAALDRKNLALQLLPYAAAAAHVMRDGASVDVGAVPGGGLFAPMPLHGDASALNRLPVALMGCFSVTRAGGRRLHPLALSPAGTLAVSSDFQRASWNRDLLGVAACAVADVLFEASRLPCGADASRWQFSLWPKRSALAGCPDASEVADGLLKPLYAMLSERPLMRLRSGACVRPSEGLFLPDTGLLGGGGARAVAFLAAHHPVLDAPHQLRLEFEAAGVAGVRELTPSAVRKLLRGTASGVVCDEEAVETRLELLGCCFADLLAPAQPAQPIAPASAAAAALGAAPGGTAAALAGWLDEAGAVDVDALRALPGMLPGTLGESAAQALIASGLGGATSGVEAPLHTLRLRELVGVPFPAADGRLLPFGSAVLVAAAGAVALLPPSARSRMAHPRCVAAHGRFFAHAGFQQALSLSPLTLPKLAPLLVHALPPLCVRAGPAAVPWDQTHPSPEWLAAFWSHVAQAGPLEEPSPGRRATQLDVFAPLALLPLTCRQLARVGEREMVFVPPGGAAGNTFAAALSAAAQSWLDAAGAGAGAASVDAMWPQLAPLLSRLNAPILDAERFPAAAALCAQTNSPPPGPLRTGADELAWRLRCASRTGRLTYGALTAADCDLLFDLFASSHAACGWLRADEGLAFLRTLPVFRTAAGRHAALDGAGVSYVTCGAESVAFVGSAAGSFHELLAQRSDARARDFLAALGVPELSDADVLARLVLPRFSSLDAAGREAALVYARRHWARLRADAPLLAALRDTRFVHAAQADGEEPASGTQAEASLRFPRELLDPRVPFLAAAFAGQPAFPSARWRTPEWAPLLREAGLCEGLDAHAAQAAARRVEAAAAAAAGARDLAAQTGDVDGKAGACEASTVAFAAAEALVAHLYERCGGYSAAVCTSLAGIAFWPARRAGTPRGERCLARISEAVLPDDWALGWAAAPTLDPRCVPPAALRARLGLRSPPAFSTFAAHLHAAAGSDGGEALLGGWPAQCGGAEEAFSAAMAHLSALWPSLSPAEVARLRGAAFVPVCNATRLVAPERLFTRCRVDCTPLAYELPPALAQHADAMRGLGARDVPRPVDVMALLVAAAASVPGAPLGPDELRAALRCAALLAEEGASDAPVAAALRRGAVPVPDAAGVLAPAAQCVRMAGARASMRRHLNVALLRPVHGQLAASAAMCAALSVPLLADIVVEELVDAPEETAEDQLAKSYRGRICSPAFVDAAAAAAAAAGSTLSYHEVQAMLHAAAARLAFVPLLRVRLLLLPARTDVTRRPVGHDGGGQPRAFFDDKAGGGKLFVAHPPPHTAPADALAAALSDLLGAPLPLPLASLLACADEAMPAVSAALMDASSPGGLAVCASCEPGALVSDAHATLLQCLPLRPFCAGETCAWREAEPVRPAAEAARAAALARAAGVPPPAPTQPRARYVRVLADARAPPGEALYRVSVEVAPGLSRFLLSTDLLSFRATRAGAGDAAASMPDTAPDVLALRTAVAPSEAARAVQQLLAASNLPLDLDRVTLVEQTLAAQAALRAAQADAVASKDAASASAADLDALSRTLVCPITQVLFEDPVICGDGHTYSRAAIERWFAQGHHTSPMSNKRLADKTLIPNHALKSVIAALNERK